MPRVFTVGPLPGKSLKWLESKGAEVVVYNKNHAPKPTKAELEQVFGSEMVKIYGVDRLSKEVMLGNASAITKEDFCNVLKEDYQVIIPWLTTPIDVECVKKANPNLRLFASYSAGLDHLPFNVASEAGILSAHTRSVLHFGVAEHTMALILCLVRSFNYQDYFFRKRLWKGKWHAEFFDYGNRSDLYNRTLGIAGFGQIGKEVYKRAKAFNMRILAYDPFMNKAAIAHYPDVRFIENLDELFKESDIVSLHMPYIAPGKPGSTHEIVGKKQLELLGKEGYLINTARGRIVNEKELVAALKNNVIAGAGLDVFYNEPFAETELYDMRLNTVLTPHTASVGSSREDGQVSDFDDLVSDVGKLRKNFDNGEILLGMSSLTVMNAYLALKGLEPLSMVHGVDFNKTLEARKKLGKPDYKEDLLA